MPITKGGLTFSEITEQVESWRDVIKLYNKHRETLIWIKKFGFNQVVFIGSGVSRYLAEYGAYLFRNVAKIPSSGFSSSEIYSGEALPFDKRLKTLVVAISRSGETSDTLWAAQHIKKIKSDVQVMSLTISPKCSLHGLSDKTIAAIGVGDEGLVPLTSFSSFLYLLSLMAGALGGNKTFLAELSAIPKRLNIREFHEEISTFRKLQDIKHFIFAGAGPYVPLAEYAALITKEMSLTTAEAYQALEFRHNHYLTLHNNSMYICMPIEKLEDLEMEAMRDAAKMRAQILILTDDIDPTVEASVEHTIKFMSNLSKYARTFYLVSCLQLIAYQHTISKKKNPDKPKNVIERVMYKSAPDLS